jgi:tight adherence protein C
MLLFIALASAATIALSIIAVMQRPPNPARVRAWSLGDEQAILSGSGTFSAGRSRRTLARRLAAILVRRLPQGGLRRIEAKLVAAGEPLDLGQFVLIWALVGITACVVGGALAGIKGLLLFGLVGLILPYLWLTRRVGRRRQLIIKALPDAIDLLVTCVEAGLGLDAALIRVGEATEGPLGEEIGLTLREIAIGRPRQEALLDLGARTGVRDLDATMRPIVQAERAGVSIADALRVQAENLRTMRRQRAEEKARKLPAKMTIVTALFFLPAVLIVAVAPPAFQLIDFFKDFNR